MNRIRDFSEKHLPSKTRIRDIIRDKPEYPQLIATTLIARINQLSNHSFLGTSQNIDSTYLFGFAMGLNLSLLLFNSHSLYMQGHSKAAIASNLLGIGSEIAIVGLSMFSIISPGTDTAFKTTALKGLLGHFAGISTGLLLRGIGHLSKKHSLLQ